LLEVSLSNATWSCEYF